MMQVFTFRSLTLSARAWGQAFQSLHNELDLEDAEDFEAFGETWPAPVPRIDYGAYRQKNRDAEALCLIGRAKLSQKDFETLRCN